MIRWSWINSPPYVLRSNVSLNFKSRPTQNIDSEWNSLQTLSIGQFIQWASGCFKLPHHQPCILVTHQVGHTCNHCVPERERERESSSILIVTRDIVIDRLILSELRTAYNGRIYVLHIVFGWLKIYGTSEIRFVVPAPSLYSTSDLLILKGRTSTVQLVSYVSLACFRWRVSLNITIYMLSSQLAYPTI